MRFQYHLPVNLIFGRGRITEIGTVSCTYGKKALVVTGKSSTKKSGLLDKVIFYLKEAGIESEVFDKVSQNPSTLTVMEGVALAKESGCDVIIGLGGGSIMDCAKAVAFMCCNDGEIHDYIFAKRTGTESLPLVLVPTTCGTGSEGNGFAVLTNTENGDKKSLRSNAIIAKASIIDSELMETMPKEVLASVGFDALCHSMEAFVSKISQPLSDLMCIEAIRLMSENLVPVYEGSTDESAWDAVTWASTMGGMVIHTAGVALPHGMEHPASGLRDIVHGRGLAALTPVITDASCMGNKEKYAKISGLLGGNGASDCGDSIRKLLEKLNLLTNLSSQGILLEDISWMTKNCFKVSAVSIKNHPVSFSEDEISKLYENAM